MLRGRVPSVVTDFPAGKDMTMLLLTLGPLGPTAIEIYKDLHADAHRLMPAFRLGASLIGGGPAATALPMEAVSFQRTFPPNFAPTGPSGPGQEGPATQALHAGRNCLSNRVASPVNGVWGETAWRTGRLCRRSDCGSPQGIFGSFLGKQKGTRPTGRDLSVLLWAK